MSDGAIAVELHGGPLDGFVGVKPLTLQPGKFPLLDEAVGKHRYVYQARQFAEDCQGTLVMDFVQIIGKHVSLLDD